MPTKRERQMVDLVNTMSTEEAVLMMALVQHKVMHFLIATWNASESKSLHMSLQDFMSSTNLPIRVVPFTIHSHNGAGVKEHIDLAFKAYLNGGKRK